MYLDLLKYRKESKLPGQSGKTPSGRALDDSGSIIVLLTSSVEGLSDRRGGKEKGFLLLQSVYFAIIKR